MEFLEKSKTAVLSHHMKAPGSSVPYFGHNGLSGIFSIDQTSQKNKAVSLQQILMSDMRSDTKLLALTGI